jgi:hypothetical protein
MSRFFTTLLNALFGKCREDKNRFPSLYLCDLEDWEDSVFSILEACYNLLVYCVGSTRSKNALGRYWEDKNRFQTLYLYGLEDWEDARLQSFSFSQFCRFFLFLLAATIMGVGKIKP